MHVLIKFTLLNRVPLAIHLLLDKVRQKMVSEFYSIKELQSFVVNKRTNFYTKCERINIREETIRNMCNIYGIFQVTSRGNKALIVHQLSFSC